MATQAAGSVLVESAETTSERLEGWHMTCLLRDSEAVSCRTCSMAARGAWLAGSIAFQLLLLLPPPKEGEGESMAARCSSTHCWMAGPWRWNSAAISGIRRLGSHPCDLTASAAMADASCVATCCAPLQMDARRARAIWSRMSPRRAGCRMSPLNRVHANLSNGRGGQSSHANMGMQQAQTVHTSV